jgi:hypothetical protein
MSYEELCTGEFQFHGLDETGYGGGLVIPFANGVHVHLFPEDYASPSNHMRAFVYHATDKTVGHNRPGAPSNREMDGAGVLAILNWAASLNLSSTLPPEPKKEKEWPELEDGHCSHCGMRYWEG